MNWHHLNARLSSQIFVQQIQVNMGRATPAVEASLKRKHKVIDGIFAMLEFWLRHGNEYLMTQSHASLADISCYNEVVQLEVMGLLTDVDAKFPKAAAWLKRMKVRRPRHLQQRAEDIDPSSPSTAISLL
jgi:glutathione S-transferase